MYCTVRYCTGTTLYHRAALAAGDGLSPGLMRRSTLACRLLPPATASTSSGSMSDVQFNPRCCGPAGGCQTQSATTPSCCRCRPRSPRHALCSTQSRSCHRPCGPRLQGGIPSGARCGQPASLDEHRCRSPAPAPRVLPAAGACPARCLLSGGRLASCFLAVGFLCASTARSRGPLAFMPVLCCAVQVWEKYGIARSSI